MIELAAVTIITATATPATTTPAATTPVTTTPATTTPATTTPATTTPATTTLPTTTPATTTPATTPPTTTLAITTGCISPYVQTPSGSCVDTMIDFNNCGTVGYVCPVSYTSCSRGVCSSAPAIKLSNATTITISSANGINLDDVVFNVPLPFNITLYNTTTDNVAVTTNGVLCLGACSTAFTETALPTSSFSGTTAFPFWDDLYIYAYTPQGIYYAEQGNAPNRSIIFEYYTTHFSQSSQYYHFQVIFFEGVPGVVQYKYFDASDGGVSCTVGVQDSSYGAFIEYSFDLANAIQPNTSIIFDTNLGIYTNSTF